MKVLLLGDYSGCHATLATGLRRLGHDVTLVSDGCSFMHIEPDIHLERGPGIIGGLTYMAKVFRLMLRWRNYDVVQFINPHFMSLRPDKLKHVFRWVAGHNRKVFVTMCSEDSFFADALVNGDVFRYSEAKVNGESTEFYTRNPWFYDNWLRPDVKSYQEEFFSRVDGLISVLPEYAMAVPERFHHKVFGAGIPVDLDKHPFTPLEIKGKVKVFLGYKRHLMQKKGTDHLQRILRELASENADRMELTEVSDLPFDQYLEQMKRADVVVDQLYAYSPATNALNAMALGKVVATGGEPEYYDWIKEHELAPIIPLRPQDCDVKERLRRYILDPRLLERMSAQGRELVERHNDTIVVARKFVDIWNGTN